MSLYIKKTQQELVPWTEDMPIDLISISEADKLNGSPKQGDMIALNPKDKTDMWLVAEQFFKDNYIPAIEATKPDNSKVIADLIKERDDELAELKELSGQLFSVITHAVSMLSGKAKQNDFVINMKGHHFFECSLLIAQISQLVDCETPHQSLAEIKAQAIKQAE
jgi:hypothetical protein